MISLVELGKIAGIAGIALGVFLTLYRDILRKKIFARLPAAESYRLLRLIIVLTWTIAVIGMGVWWQGSRPLPLKAEIKKWNESSVVMNQLAIGMSRNYVLNVAGIPPDSIDATVGKTGFRVDRYGDNCCGELILFFQKDSLVGFTAKHFSKPDFDFSLYYAVPDNFKLGKTTYNDINHDPQAVKDEHQAGPMTLCYIEAHYFGKPGDYHEFLYSTALNTDSFDRKKYTTRREMPVDSVLVVGGPLFCEAKPDKNETSESDERQNCIDPWEAACSYFDNMATSWR
jgi:hypothetical protein